jgi:hypothetical protein
MPDAKGFVLCLLGGAEATDRARRGGFWCEDTYAEMSMLRHLMLVYEPLGIRFLAVMCPPVYHEERFGYEAGAFLERGSGDPIHERNRRLFVEKTLRLVDRDVLPFSRVYFDPRFRLLAEPDSATPPPTDAGSPPPWQGRFKWYEDTQTYGTPTLWILDSDLTVFGVPFFMNVYESEGRAIRYTVRDVAARLDRLLAAE